MKFFSLSGLFISLFGIATTANAFDGILNQCQSCTTDAYFRQTAKSYYDVGDPTLYNLKTGVIHSYRLSIKRGYPLEADPSPDAIEVTEVATDPAIYNAFVHLSGFYQAVGFKLQGKIAIPYTDLGPNIPGLDQRTSAYDVTEDYNLRNRLGIEIVNNRDRWNQVRSFLNTVWESALAYFGLKEMSLEVQITFADGSSVQYRMTANSANQTKLEYVPGSATTPKNQGIPDANQPQYQGKWYGSGAGGDDMNRFGRHMNAIGASTDWNYNGGGTSPREVICTWKAGQSGNTIVCTATAY